MIIDKESFIAGVQLGRRLKVWDSLRQVAPAPLTWPILTENDMPILTESGEELLQQIIPPIEG